jgi:hypothetical protein
VLGSLLVISSISFISSISSASFSIVIHKPQTHQHLGI